MKTATIKIYHIYGTRNEYCAEVFYRGQLLNCAYGMRHDDTGLICARWALKNGFTHLKYID